MLFRTETKFQETPKTSQLDLKEDFDLPHSVLSNMQGLIEEGQLSREDVIEHLINNGFLPVEVTELGRLPITVGVPDVRGDHSKSGFLFLMFTLIFSSIRRRRGGSRNEKTAGKEAKHEGREGASIPGAAEGTRQHQKGSL